MEGVARGGCCGCSGEGASAFEPFPGCVVRLVFFIVGLMLWAPVYSRRVGGHGGGGLRGG